MKATDISVVIKVPETVEVSFGSSVDERNESFVQFQWILKNFLGRLKVIWLHVKNH